MQRSVERESIQERRQLRAPRRRSAFSVFYLMGDRIEMFYDGFTKNNTHTRTHADAGANKE